MNMDKAQILDKAQGALIGSALGDAIGIFTGIAILRKNTVP
jgi:ADP-ribosylglycohydrolase